MLGADLEAIDQTSQGQSMAAVLPEDSGIIRCICDYDHDDNFTIQCERCNAWQHATCVNIKDENAVPEHYMCPECNNAMDAVNRDRAREHQQRFLQQRAEQLKHTRFQVGDDHDEDRRRRGSRKRQSVPDIAKPVADPVPRFEHKYFVIPTTELDWTAGASKVWADIGEASDLPRIPPKELKSMPSLQVSRSDSAEWRIGVHAGAVSPAANVAANRPVCELFGEVMLRSEYSSEPTNQFSRLGCPKFGVVFVPGLPFALDMRRHGSRDALFLRRSSNPNARLVAAKDPDNRLRVFVYSRKPIKAGVELSLGWHWPLGHPIRNAITTSLAGETNDDKNAYEFVKTALWLLEASLQSCAPCDTKGEVDEDWTVAEIKPPPPPRPRKRAEELLPTMEPADSEEADPGVAVAMHVWVPAPISVAPPPKKRMSLKDYMRKRA